MIAIFQGHYTDFYIFLSILVPTVIVCVACWIWGPEPPNRRSPP